MFFSRKNKGSSFDKEYYDNLEKETVRKRLSRKEKEDSLSDEDKKLLHKYRFITAIYMPVLYIVFFINFIAGLITAVVSCTVLYIISSKKFPQYKKIFPAIAGLITFFWISDIGFGYLSKLDNIHFTKDGIVIEKYENISDEALYE